MPIRFQQSQRWFRSGACLVLLTSAARSALSEPPPLPDPKMLFAEAVAADLGIHGRPDAERAFSLYSQAAQAGLAPAQLNVAVMLDSGRGARHDPAAAATYYALAASQGIARAAYDLGQLYADGEGVPVNPGLSRAWMRLAASHGISAARSRMSALPPPDPASAAVSPSPPIPVLPTAGARLSRRASLQFVWTASAQPALSQFYVEVTALEGGAPHDVFTMRTELSAITSDAPPLPGRYAWRVFTVCQTLARYVASPWVPFSVS